MRYAVKFHCNLYLKAKYIAECLDEIKQELKSGDLQAKANAVGKLLYVSCITSSIDNIMCPSAFLKPVSGNVCYVS